MIDSILALVPGYGLYLLFGVVFVACLAVPLPASLLVLTAGSFAASGQMSLINVFLVSFAAFVLGDQVAYSLARRIGPPLFGWLRKSPRVGPVLDRSEDLLQRKGALAVFLSHTIFSPTCAYISYLSGAGGLAWRAFSWSAVPGAFVWTLAYVGLGYVFASQLDVAAQALSNFFGIIMAGAVAIGCFVVLRSRWKAMHSLTDPEPTETEELA